jgi:hypothetical protein
MTQDAIEEDLTSLNISSSSSVHDEVTDTHGAQSQAADMHQRAKLLLDELVCFQQYLKDKKREDAVYLSAFKSDVQQELKLLEKVLCAST